MIKIGITHGDINGIGYELILKALSDPHVPELFIPVLYGSSKVATYHRKAMEIQPVNFYVIDKAVDAVANRVNIINCVSDDVKVELGKHTDESAKSAVSSLEKALKDLQDGVIDALFTSPAIVGNGQTAYIENTLGKVDHSLSILVKDSLRIALATGNIPFSSVTKLLSADLIYQKLLDLKTSLIRDFAVTAPRIAVLSLNPDTEQIASGSEEQKIIIPAMEKASKEGVFCFGPYTSDEFFGSGNFTKFDGILAMYHDQGMVPFRTLSNEEGACFTANLPVIRTASNLGPSFETAGQNIISPDSFLNAIYLAIDVFNNRAIDREINSNPLRKHYFERGSDNEKLDLTSDTQD